MLAQRFVDRTNGFFARDKERDNHEGINHDVAQRKQRQLFRICSCSSASAGSIARETS